MSNPCRSAATRRRLLAACRAGHLPAEALDTRDRDQLVAELWRCGLTDVEIATRTHMSTYTTARIRTRLRLPARRATSGAA